MVTTIIVALISIAVGGGVTFLVARWYYERASGDLKREAGELKDYTVMMINYLEDASVIAVERDAHGDPVRVRVVRHEIADSVGASDSIEAKPKREVGQLPQEEDGSGH
jgi:hypothetical protein